MHLSTSLAEATGNEYDLHENDVYGPHVQELDKLNTMIHPYASLWLWLHPTFPAYFNCE